MRSLRKEIRASFPSGSLSVHSPFAVAKLTSGTSLSSALRNAGTVRALFRSTRTRDRGQSYLDVFVIQHRFELGEVWLPRADQAERLYRVLPLIWIFVLQGVLEKTPRSILVGRYNGFRSLAESNAKQKGKNYKNGPHGTLQSMKRARR